MAESKSDTNSVPASQLAQLVSLSSVTSIPKRKHLLTVVLPKVAGSDSDKETLAQVAAELASTLISYSDRASKAYVEQAIISLVKADYTFAKQFVKELVLLQKARAKSAHLSSRCAITLSRWSFLVLRSCPELVENDQAAVSMLFTYLASTLEFLLPVETSCWKGLYGLSSHAFFKGGEKLVETALASITKPDKCFVFTHLVSWHLEKRGWKGSDAIKSQRVPLLKQFNELVLSSKGDIPLFVAREAFAALFPSLSVDEYKEHIHPNITRMFKRSPQVIIITAQAIFEKVTIALDEFASELVPFILSEAASDKEDRSQRGVETAKALAHRCHEPSVVAEFLELTRQTLVGKKGSLGTALQRNNVLSIVEMFSTVAAVGDAALAKMATQVVEIVSDFLDKEPLKDVREVAINSATHFVITCDAADAVEPLSQLLLKGLAGSGKNSGMEAVYLAAINEIISSSTLPTASLASSDNLSSATSKLLKEAVAKPHQLRHNGILAATVMLTLAEKDLGRLEETRATLVPLFKDGDSVFNAPQLILKATDAENVAAVDVVLAGLKVEAVPALFTTLGFLLASSEQKVSVYAQKQTRAFLNASPSSLRVALARAQSDLLYRNAFEGECKTSKTTTPSSTTLTNALLVSTGKELDDESPSGAVIPALFLALHHPSLQSKAFELFLARAAAENWTLDVAAVVEKNADAFVSYLAGSEGLFHTDSLIVSAAVALSGSLMKHAPAFVVKTVTEQLILRLSAAEIGAFSAYHLAVYNTDDNELCTWVDPSQYQAEVVERKLSEDEEWERQTRAELAKKNGKGGNAKKVKLTKEQHAKLEEEKAIRANVKQLLAHASAFLSVAQSITRVAPHQVHATLLPILLNEVKLLVRCPEVRKPALNLVDLLAQGNEPFLASKSSISLAVQQVFLRRDQTFSNETTADLVTSAIATASKLIKKNGAVSPTTFVYLFPLLENRILSAQDLSSPEDSKQYLISLARLRPALKVVAAHCSQELKSSETEFASFPRTEMAFLLLHVMNNHPPLTGFAQQPLLELAGSMSFADVQSLVGDLGVLSPLANVRLTCVKGLGLVHDLSQSTSAMLLSKLWLLLHDSDDEVTRAAQALWDQTGCKLPEGYTNELMKLLSHTSEHVRLAAGRAIAGGLQATDAVQVSTAIDGLVELFTSSPDEEVRDQFGIPITNEMIYRHETRDGVMAAFGACVDVLSNGELLTKVFHFFVQRGFADQNDKVWERTLASGHTLINEHGATFVNMLLPVFEGYLSGELNTEAKSEDIQDRIREGVVVFMGSVAQFMPSNSPRMGPVVDSLIEVLKTPSFGVQEAVSQCLAPLIPHVAKDAERFINVCLDRLRGGATFGERKGAAFGLASIVRGLKLSALKKYGILDSLAAMCTESNNVKAREGAMLAYERLFSELGSAFEPYIVLILPHMLNSFGDSSQDVRDATQEASRMVMSVLTAQGVKMVLPLILKSLEEKVWRKRVESIEMLGSMAYCAPHQLSASLPMIVPRLLTVMTDPHNKVQEAARKALHMIGSVIRNPEIRVLVPVMMEVLKDSAANIQPALDALIKTSFVHSVDPPSLALVIPIIRKGLCDRSVASKKMACQVVGSICSLIQDVKDILPYSKTLVKYVRALLMDPSPEVRTVASRALGSLFKGIGDQDMYDEIIAFLVETLEGDTTNVQRSGSAQALCQILHARGVEYMEDMLSVIFEHTRSKQPKVREGFFELFTFLPDAFRGEFAVFLEQVIPVVLGGLDDESGPVREVALRAGRSLIIRYADSHMDMLLPGLETGIVDSSWRVRQGSVQLLGGLMKRLCGHSRSLFVGAVDLIEEDGGQSLEQITRQQELSMIERLGEERYFNIMSLMYLMHSDSVHSVSQYSWLVWKNVVSNTPRTLMLIFPTLMNLIIADLASSELERQAAAGASLGELVSKMGDSVVEQILPILKERLKNDDGSSRRGVCLGLREIMQSAHKSYIGSYLNELIPAVRDALCDELQSVREAAGLAFETLYNNVGDRAIDEIVPALISQLESSKADDDDDDGDGDDDERDDDGEGEDEDEDEGEDQSELALEGIREILQIAQHSVLKYLIPALSESPLTLFRAQALAALCDVFGSGFYRYVSNVMVVLVEALAAAYDDPDEYAEMLEAGESVVLSVGKESIHQMVVTLVQIIDDAQDVPSKCACADLISAFVAGTQHNFHANTDALMRALLNLYVHEDKAVQDRGVTALDNLVKSIPKEKLASHVPALALSLFVITHDSIGEQTVETVGGFCNNRKGLAPLQLMLQDGLMQGSPAIREKAASTLGVVVSLTSLKALQPYVVKITGPLIRIVGDNFPSPVKTAIMSTLELLITKAGAFLKPFLPQLQTTFVKKALNDSDKAVRDRGCSGIAALLELSRRAAPVVNDLITDVRSKPENPIKISLLQALTGIFEKEKVTAQLSEEILLHAREVALEFITSEKQKLRVAAADFLGCALTPAAPEAVSGVVSSLLADSNKWEETHGRVRALGSIVSHNYDRMDEKDQSIVVDFVEKQLDIDNVIAREDVVRTAFRILAAKIRSNQLQEASLLLTRLVKTFDDKNGDIRLTCSQGIHVLARDYYEFAWSNRELLLVSLADHTAEQHRDNRKSVQMCLYFLLSFNKGREAGVEKSQAVLSALGKKHAAAVAALELTIKKSVSKLNHIDDEEFVLAAL